MLAPGPAVRCNKLNLQRVRRTWRAGGVGVSIQVALRSAAATVAAAAAVAKIGGAGAFNAAPRGVAARQGGPFLRHGSLSQRRTFPGRIQRFAIDEAAIEKYRESESQDKNQVGEAAPVVSDDGRILDTSTFVGSIGALVVSIALLPYPAFALYTAWSLANSGRLLEIITVEVTDGGLKLAPTALLGVLQCFSLVVVFGVVLWSVISSITRSSGLPAGPFGLLALSQDLAFTGVFFFLVAFGLNSLPPNENPVRGLSLSSPDQIFAAAQKASKLAEKGATEAAKLSVEASKVAEKESSELLAATAPQRKDLDMKIADVQKKASESLSSTQAKLTANLKPKEATSSGLLDKQVSDKDVPNKDISGKTVPSTNVPNKDVSSKDVPSKDVPSKDVSSKDVPSKDVPSKDVPSKDVPSTDVTKKDKPEKAEVKDAPSSAASLPALSKTSKP